MTAQAAMQHSVESATLADLLERVLDKGLVIWGDIKVKLVDVELLTIQLRLVICSVDKAREMGIDWWANSGVLNNEAKQGQMADTLAKIEERLGKLESSRPKGTLKGTASRGRRAT